MKKPFTILKNRPEVTIHLTRDSVCAGDDCDAPHDKIINVKSFLEPKVLVSNIYTNYLPTVSGYGHTWDCILNDIIIATISVDGIEQHVFEVTYHDTNSMHFKYNSSAY